MEPQWTDLPPQPSALPHLPLERIKPGGLFKAVLTTHSILGVWTHFMGGRTLACLSGECPGCKSQLPRRWEGYAACWTFSPSRHIIIALTPGAALGIGDSARDPHRLRGLLVHLERVGRRNNSRLKGRVEEIEQAQLRLPPEPDLKAHLIHIWGLDQSHASMENPGYANRVKDLLKSNGHDADASSVH